MFFGVILILGSREVLVPSWYLPLFLQHSIASVLQTLRTLKSKLQTRHSWSLRFKVLMKMHGFFLLKMLMGSQRNFRFRGSSGAGEPSENVRFWQCSGRTPESHGVFFIWKNGTFVFSSLLGLQAKIFSKWKRNSTQLCCGWIFLHAVGDNTWACCFCLKVKGFLVFVFRCCFLRFFAFLCCTRWLIVHLFLNLWASFCSAWFHLFSCFFVTEEPK